MASNTKKTTLKRERRHRKAGRDRKREMNKAGTTRSETELFGSALADTK